MNPNPHRAGGTVVLIVAALFCGLPSAVLLDAPAVAAHIALSGSPRLTAYQREWLWGAAAAPLFALWLVRVTASARGRLRGGRMRRVLRPVAYLLRTGLLLTVVNAVSLLELTRSERLDSVVPDGGRVFGISALAGLLVLIAVRLWDRRPEPVSVDAVKAAARDVDRALNRVRAENKRVSRQSAQLQSKLTAAHLSEVDFRSLCVVHHESFRCADGAYAHYRSAQATLGTVASMIHQIRVSQYSPAFGRAAKQARAELRTASADLVQANGELRTHVDKGLGMVRTLNANTAELKHSIRDSCGARGRRWFDDLELRTEARQAG